jgi:hypothetical protein
MKKKNVALLVLAAVATSAIQLPAVYAREPIAKIATEKQRKAAVVKALRDQLTRHEGMKTLKDVQDDLKKTAELSRKKVSESDISETEKAAYEKITAASIEAIDAMESKDEVVMLEKAQLQKLETSENYIFGLTDNFLNSDAGKDPTLVLLVLPLIVLVDLVTLPFTVIMSAVTGF